MSFLEMEVSPIKKNTVHPKVSVMVDTAITTLAAPKGSSLHAINKYISENYNADVQKLSVYIKKYLKSAVERGEIVKPSGKGATGSFKMSKQKVEGKSSKPLKMRTSTPKKTLKPRKAYITEKSPVKKLKLTDDEEMYVDSTFVIPKTKIGKKLRISVPTKTSKSKVSLPAKVKKPKKLMAKVVKEPKDLVSPKEKLDNTITSPKHVKAKGTTKALKAKKNAKPKIPADSILRKVVLKKRPAED